MKTTEITPAQEIQLNALASFLNCSPDELTPDYEYYGTDVMVFERGDEQYICVNEEDREIAVAANIEQSLWAFKASFILDFIGADATDNTIKAFEKMQSELCEDANDLIKAMVRWDNEQDDFITSAIDADEYGHFLAQYDGVENEHEFVFKDEDGTPDTTTFFIYRIN